MSIDEFSWIDTKYIEEAYVAISNDGMYMVVGISDNVCIVKCKDKDEWKNYGIGIKKDEWKFTRDIVDCSICFKLIIKDTKELECKHKFHTNCINNWLKQNKTCPICRKDVEYKNIEENNEIISYGYGTYRRNIQPYRIHKHDEECNSSYSPYNPDSYNSRKTYHPHDDNVYSTTNKRRNCGYRGYGI